MRHDTNFYYITHLGISCFCTHESQTCNIFFIYVLDMCSLENRSCRFSLSPRDDTIVTIIMDNVISARWYSSRTRARFYKRLIETDHNYDEKIFGSFNRKFKASLNRLKEIQEFTLLQHNFIYIPGNIIIWSIYNNKKR